MDLPTWNVGEPKFNPNSHSTFASKHELTKQKAFATPHSFHLVDVYNVGEKDLKPSHTTANSIRSVIEGMWKFCYPNIDTLGEFLKYLISKHNFEVESILINHYSHGGMTDEPLITSDIKLAAKEAIWIVNKFAEGQLKFK